MNTRLQNHNVAIGYKSASHLARHVLDQAGIAEFAMCVGSSLFNGFAAFHSFAPSHFKMLSDFGVEFCIFVLPPAEEFHGSRSRSVVCFGCYSLRKAISGSTFVARRAGIQHASAATANSNSAMEMNVETSVALTP